MNLSSIAPLHMKTRLKNLEKIPRAIVDKQTRFVGFLTRRCRIQQDIYDRSFQ
jgi:hypothetical protein